MKKEYKLYKTFISYFKENKEDYPRSTIGKSCYFIASTTAKSAKQIALNEFYKENRNPEEYDVVKPTTELVKLPEFVKFSGEGILNFIY